MSEITFTKEELLNECRFYKGEEESPFKNDDQRHFFWFYERCWLLDTMQNMNMITEYLGDYINVGLSDFEKNDGVVITLKAYLFHAYAKGCWSMASAVNGFKSIYHQAYKN